jgi:hypothetical protein
VDFGDAGTDVGEATVGAAATGAGADLSLPHEVAASRTAMAMNRLMLSSLFRSAWCFSGEHYTREVLGVGEAKSVMAGRLEGKQVGRELLVGKGSGTALAKPLDCGGANVLSLYS